MIHTTNLYTRDMTAYMRTKFAGLVAECPGLDLLFGFPRPHSGFARAK